MANCSEATTLRRRTRGCERSVKLLKSEGQPVSCDYQEPAPGMPGQCGSRFAVHSPPGFMRESIMILHLYGEVLQLGVLLLAEAASLSAWLLNLIG